jgi:hypothetical protein
MRTSNCVAAALVAFAVSSAAAVAGQSVDAAAPEGPGLRRSSAEALTLPVPRRFHLSHVDPAHFAAALGKNPTRIFNFVRDQIAFESYDGALRGPRGTLLAMAGNSVDRASLLGAMLTASGQRVRYVSGTLPPAQVDRLIASMWRDRGGRASAAATVPAEIKAAGDLLFTRVEHDGRLLLDRLRQAGIPGSEISATTAEALAEETREHYWVQWLRDGVWTDLDPSFASGQPGQTYTTAQETFDALPDRLFHRIELRVKVEEYTGPAPASRVVLQYAARAADLSALDLILAHEPKTQNDTWTNEYTPVLIVNGESRRGEPFWLMPPKQVAAAAIVDAFGGGSDPEPSPVAMAESVEMEFIAPGGATDTVVREIFDRVGRSRRMKHETLTAEQVANAAEPSNPDFTQGVYDFFVTTGAIDSSHVKNLDAEAPPTTAPGTVDVAAGFRSMNITFAVLSDALLGRFTDKSGRIVRTYQDSPRV